MFIEWADDNKMCATFLKMCINTLNRKCFFFVLLYYIYRCKNKKCIYYLIGYILRNYANNAENY